MSKSDIYISGCHIYVQITIFKQQSVSVEGLDSLPAEILCSKKTNISSRTKFEGLYASFLEHKISKGKLSVHRHETKTLFRLYYSLLNFSAAPALID